MWQHAHTRASFTCFQNNMTCTTTQYPQHVNIHKSQVFVKYTSRGNAALQSIPGQQNMGFGLQPCPYFLSQACLIYVNSNWDHGQLLSNHLLSLYHLHLPPILFPCTFMECMGQLLFGAEYFVFQFATQKFKDQDV